MLCILSMFLYVLVVWLVFIADIMRYDWLTCFIPGHYSSVMHLQINANDRTRDGNTQLINLKCFSLSGKISNLGLAVLTLLSVVQCGKVLVCDFPKDLTVS